MWFLKILGMYLLLIVTVGILAYTSVADIALTVLAVAILISPVVVIAGAGVHFTRHKKEIQEKSRIDAEKRRITAEKREAERQKLAESQRIVEVKYLGGGTTNYKRNGLGGAVVGAMVAGGIGAVIGGASSSGKGKQKEKFAVRYGDGSVKIVECERGSRRYGELMKYVKWEEL